MPRLDARSALLELQAGNRRYAAGKATRPRQTAERRSEVAKGQEPLAVVVSCSDSRVPPEIVFDCGLGDLFVIRTAGHVIDEMVLASVEYGVEHLGIPLVLVLGHSSCGAVKAAIEGGGSLGHLSSLLAAVRPAVADAQGQSGDIVANAVRANVQRAVRRLESSALALAGSGGENRLLIAGAIYDLATGEVSFF